jgi:16S rRNA (cytidine1402-2'-O)-methyltransferase
VNTIDAPLLRQAAAAAAGGQSYPAGALYVVATPIGNLADLSLRAIHLLALADAIACEDTRHSAPLLRALGIEGKPLLAVHEHNERAAAAGVIERLQRGERVAFVSDAGTPAVSDPGAALVAAVSAAGQRCIPVPGASSAAAALSVAGDAQGQGFVFHGFLPIKAGERAQALQRIAADAHTAILFEAPHRIAPLAAELAASCGARRVTVCRELTKQFEAVSSLPADTLPQWLAEDANRLRGEFVLVIHALDRSGDEALPDRHDRVLDALLAALPLKQAVALAVELTGAPRNALYGRALARKRDSQGD